MKKPLRGFKNLLEKVLQKHKICLASCTTEEKEQPKTVLRPIIGIYYQHNKKTQRVKQTSDTSSLMKAVNSMIMRKLQNGYQRPPNKVKNLPKWYWRSFITGDAEFKRTILWPPNGIG